MTNDFIAIRNFPYGAGIASSNTNDSSTAYASVIVGNDLGVGITTFKYSSNFIDKGDNISDPNRAMIANNQGDLYIMSRSLASPAQNSLSHLRSDVRSTR